MEETPEKKSQAKNYRKNHKVEEDSTSIRNRTFESSPIPIVIMDTEKFQFIDCNPAAIKIYKFKSRNETIGKTPLDVSAEFQYDGKPSKDKGEYYNQKALTEGIVTFEWRHQRENGEIWDAEVQLLSFTAEGKKFLQFSLVDITEKKKGEKEILKSRANLKAIIENTTDSIWAINTNYELIYINGVFEREFFESFGIHLKKGTNLLDAIPEPLKPEWKSRYDRAFNNEHFFFEDKIELGGGNFVYIQVAMNPIVINENVIGASFFASNITERKQAEVALKESERKYQELYTLMRLMSDTLPDMLWAKDLNRKYIFANDAFCKKLLNASSTNEPIGKTDLFFAERERNSNPANPNWHTFDELCMDTDATTLQEMKEMHFDEFGYVKGEFLYLDVHKAPLFDQNKKLIGIVGTARDVTEQKRIEEKLKRSETTYRGILNELSELVYIQDEKGRFLDVNAAVEKKYGYEKSYFIGKTPECLAAPGLNNLEHIASCIQKAGKGTIQRFDFWGITKKGEIFPKEVSVAPGVYFGKKVIVATARDITQRKKAETALKKTESNLQALINNRNESIWSIDKDYKLIISNEFFRDSFYVTYNKKLEVGYNLIETLPDNLKLFWKPKVDRALTGEKVSFEFSELIMGGKNYFNIFLNPIISNNEVTGVSALAVDITALKKTEDELIKAKEKAEESDHLKSSFLANMSHEIRTPMNGILGFANLLKKPNLTDKQQADYVQVIEKSGARMLAIINDLIDISKIESGQMNINLSRANINQQTDYIHDFFKPEVEAKGMKFFVKNALPFSDAYILSDPEKLYAILANLVKNAIKYTNKGSIELAYQLNAENIVFSVKDTGIGIPKNRLLAIFDRFVQADISDKNAKQGAGLGLSIAKAYTEMLGGEIWVESLENKGSTFYFKIPYNKPTIEPDNLSPNLKENEANSKTNKLKVLIAEDEETSDMLLTISLEEICKEILHVKTGTEAVEICKTNPDIDLIMMDIKMPEMNGYEATQKIREFNNRVVIIAQTAFGLAGDKQKALDAGCNDYIAKPINTDLLMALIKKHENKLNDID